MGHHREDVEWLRARRRALAHLVAVDVRHRHAEQRGHVLRHVVGLEPEDAIGMWHPAHGVHGSYQCPEPARSFAAPSGPQVPGAYGSTGGGASRSGCTIRHCSSTASWRVKRRVSPVIAAWSSTSYGVGPSPPSCANSISRLIGWMMVPAPA